MDTKQLRQRIAQVSARMMVEEGICDYHSAKCKAAIQLGVPHTKHLPSNSEIEEQIVLHQRLFLSDSHPQALQKLRQVALEAMRLLTAFSPRLVGAVLQGTAHQHSDVVLHLFSDTPEEVAFFLMEHNIPYELSEKRFRLPEVVNYPNYRFIAGQETVSLIVFNKDDIRWSPPSPVDGKPMRRADMRAVENLLQAYDR